MTKCPVCRAAITEQEVCRRCQSNLSLLFTIEQDAEALAGKAVRALAAGRPEEAEELARQSLFLQQTPFIKKLHHFLTTYTSRRAKGSFAEDAALPSGRWSQRQYFPCQRFRFSNRFCRRSLNWWGIRSQRGATSIAGWEVDHSRWSTTSAGIWGRSPARRSRYCSAVKTLTGSRAWNRWVAVEKLQAGFMNRLQTKFQENFLPVSPGQLRQ